MEKQPMKTKCYYTDYVNHMIRFYLSCPETLKTDGKRRSDVENWIAVQGVLHNMPEPDRVRLEEVYKTHYNLPKAVEMYCLKTGAEKNEIWVLITKTAALIARRRGLV